jgi:glutamate-ammonia-ligase adenylyltransferase
MGKLGSRELTAGSDIDLILLYDHDADAEESDGEKPLAASHYFSRMTQRLIAAVSAPTAEGVLYELDLRLRPSGNKGPVATHIDAFRKYQETEAWTWEHMALTRARPAAGDASLCEEVAAIVANILARPRETAKIFADAVEMRKTIETEKPPRDQWDIKLIPGGLIDLEFIAQCAALTGKIEGESRHTGRGAVLAKLKPDFASPQVKDELSEAYAFYSGLTQVIRLCLTGPLERNDLPPSMADLLLAVADAPDLSVLEATLKDTSANVRKHFNALLGRGKR